MSVTTQRRRCGLAGLLLWSALASAQSSVPAAALPPVPPPTEYELATMAKLPAYTAAAQVHGTVRLWGHGAPVLDFMGVLVHAWMEEFAKFQPGVTIVYDMYGTASAMGALYTGSGDIAMLGQEIYPFELETFRKVKHYAPTEIEVATGSVDVRNFDFTIGAFVNRQNPLVQLTLDQVDRAFAWHAAASGRNATTWGELGLTGEWADRPIHLYGWPQEDVFSTFVERTALHESHRWRCGMTKFENIVRPDGTIYDSGQQILDALAKDTYGLALSNLRYLPPDKDSVKELAVARAAGGPFYQATKETAIEQQYPLTRIIPALIDRMPGQPVEPAVREFLLYLLSREGQAQIVRNGRYLPLNPAFAAAQREKLR